MEEAGGDGSEREENVVVGEDPHESVPIVERREVQVRLSPPFWTFGYV